MIRAVAKALAELGYSGPIGMEAYLPVRIPKALLRLSPKPLNHWCSTPANSQNKAAATGTTGNRRFAVVSLWTTPWGQGQAWIHVSGESPGLADPAVVWVIADEPVAHPTRSSHHVQVVEVVNTWRCHGRSV